MQAVDQTHLAWALIFSSARTLRLIMAGTTFRTETAAGLVSTITNLIIVACPVCVPLLAQSRRCYHSEDGTISKKRKLLIKPRVGVTLKPSATCSWVRGTG